MNTDMVMEQIERMRKKNLLVHIVVIVMMLTMVFGTIVFYELRLRSVTGAVYQADESASKLLVQKLFETGVNSDNLSIADEAVKNAGYTENGFEYLFSYSGQNVIVILALVIAVAICVYAGKEYIGTKKSYIYPVVIELSKENEHLKEQLDTSVKYQEKRNKQLQDFIENVAHQVKTPLTALGMAIDMGKSRDDCFFHIDRIREFIQRLMNISRMESGKVIFAREDINVEHMLEDAVASSGVDADCVKILCNDEKYSINGDRGWLKESFINIITNSCEYIRGIEGGEVVVKADCREEKCVITVEDNGPGFGREDINSIFDRFETDKDAKAFHVGIGLNLAKLIIEAHHGTIYACNAYGHAGAQFRVVIPRYNLKKGKSVQ